MYKMCSKNKSMLIDGIYFHIYIAPQPPRIEYCVYIMCIYQHPQTSIMIV